jgi:protein-tyrosine phosphatase
MIPPLVDMHCHLLAGFDDGPGTDEEALAMCRLAYDDGVRIAAAGAHQNERYPAVTAERILEGATRLARLLQEAGIPLEVFPCGEVMAHPEMAVSWRLDKLMSVANRRQFVLLEPPHGLYVDLMDTVMSLRQAGLRTILAHPERCEELLHEPGQIESFIDAGCLVQVSARSVTAPVNRRHERALKSWFKRGVVHLLGSDGHSPGPRPPLLGGAYRRMVRWIGSSRADQVCSTNGLRLIQGRLLRVSRPVANRVMWFWPLYR